MKLLQKIFAFVGVVALSTVPLQCMNEFMSASEDIQTLAQLIDCSDSEALCKSIHKLTQTETYAHALLVEAIKYAFQRDGITLLSSVDKENETALHLASWFGYSACALALLDVADSSNDEHKTLRDLLLAVNSFGSTALLVACSQERGKDCVNLLKKKYLELDIEISECCELPVVPLMMEEPTPTEDAAIIQQGPDMSWWNNVGCYYKNGEESIV